MSVGVQGFGSACMLIAACLVVPGVPGVGGQEPGTISGRVFSAIAPGPPVGVPGMTVRVEGIGRSVVTDDSGFFALYGVPSGRHGIQFEVIGCAVTFRELDLNPGSVAGLEVTIDRPAIVLPGLAVTGPSSVIDDKEVHRYEDLIRIDPRRGGGGRTVANLIRGEFPGIRIVQGSGLPGSEASIQFRGPTSLSGGQHPLVVVDGATVIGGLIDLNPDDIENITILKGAAAAAHYGSRGQAGVIEISTRRGAHTAPAARGPVLLLDGMVSTRRLSEIEPELVADLELISGPAAGVLLGQLAGETGVLKVTTVGREAADAQDSPLAHCVPSG